MLRSARLWIAARPGAAFVLALLLYTASQVPGLADAPAVGGDEAWVAGVARAWRVDGRLRNPMLDQIWPENLAVIKDAQMCNGWIAYFTALGTWTGIVGEDLRSQRLSSWLLGSAAIGLAYVVAARFGGPAAGLWAAALLATRSLFWASSRMVRPDTAMALLFLATFALWLRATDPPGDRPRARPDPMILALLAGCAAGLAPGFHANGIILAPALLLISVWRRPAPRAALAMLAGWFISTLALASHIQISDVAAGWTWQESGWRYPPILRHPWRAVFGALVEPFSHFRGDLHFTPDPDFRSVTVFELAALYPALATCWIQGARPLVLFTGALLLASSCLNGLKRGVYLMYFYPVFAVALGVFAADLRRQVARALHETNGWRLLPAIPAGLGLFWLLLRAPPVAVAVALLLLWTAASRSGAVGPALRRAVAGEAPRALPACAALILATVLTAGGLAAAYVGRRTMLRGLADRSAYADLEAEVRAAVPPGASVFGPHWLWFALRDHEYRDGTALVMTGWWRRGTLEDHLSRFRPDFIISDEGLRAMYFRKHRPKASGMLTLKPELARPHRLVGRLDSGWNSGKIEIYRVDWRSPGTRRGVPRRPRREGPRP